jgi:hypothetical protein
MRTTPLPFGNVIFCDDIRQEAGGKLSLMGIYHSDMVFAAGTTFPLMLPKLGVLMTWFESAATPDDDLMFKIGLRRLETDPEAEDDHPLGEITLNTKEAKAAAASGRDLSGAYVRAHLSHTIVFSPCLIPFPGLLRVRVVTGGEVWGLGAINVVAAS